MRTFDELAAWALSCAIEAREHDPTLTPIEEALRSMGHGAMPRGLTAEAQEPARDHLQWLAFACEHLMAAAARDARPERETVAQIIYGLWERIGNDEGLRIHRAALGSAGQTPAPT